MLVNSKIFSLNRLTNNLFCFLPISFIIGSLIVTVNLYLFLIISLFYIHKKKYKFNLGHTNIILISFFLLIIISSLINIDSIKYYFFIKSILLFRFAILYLIVETLIINDQLNLRKFFVVSLLGTTFLSFDIIVQYLFGYDLFGYEPWQGRLTGFLYTEAVAGSYIQKFSLFSFFGFLLFYKKQIYKKELLFSIILLHAMGIFLASNRISVATFVLGLLILIFFDKKNKPTIVYSLIAFLSISTILINVDNNLKNKYINFFQRLGVNINSVENNTSETKETNKKNKKISLNESFLHAKIYLSTIETWKNNPVIGGGHKSFRTECANILKSKKYITCSTHPHNYHLEILQDAGLIGFFIIGSFIFILLFLVLKKIKNKKFTYSKYSMYFLPIIISMLVEIWPIKSTGSLFSTISGTSVWLTIALCSIVKVKIDRNKLDQPIKDKRNFILIYFLILLAFLLIKKIWAYIYLLPSFHSIYLSIFNN